MARDSEGDDERRVAGRAPVHDETHRLPERRGRDAHDARRPLLREGRRIEEPREAGHASERMAHGEPVRVAPAPAGHASLPFLASRSARASSHAPFTKAAFAPSPAPRNAASSARARSRTRYSARPKSGATRHALSARSPNFRRKTRATRKGEDAASARPSQPRNRAPQSGGRSGARASIVAARAGDGRVELDGLDGRAVELPPRAHRFLEQGRDPARARGRRPVGAEDVGPARTRDALVRGREESLLRVHDAGHLGLRNEAAPVVSSGSDPS